MLRNNLIIAWRNLMRHRLHTVINLAGLSLGMAFCLLAWRFASQEWSFDLFHSKADRIYRVYVEAMGTEEGLMRIADVIEFAFAPELEALSPHVERTVRLSAGHGSDREDRVVRITFEGNSGDEEFLLVDPAFFEVFDFPLMRGNASTALAERNSVVLSYEMAQRLFGDVDPVGQSLTIAARRGSNVEDFTITGVAAPVPRTSSIQFNMLLPFDNTEFIFRDPPDAWEGSCNAYVLLASDADPADVTPAFVQLTQNMIQSDGQEIPEDLPEDFSLFRLQPLTELRSDTSLTQWSGHVVEPRAPYISYVLVSIALAVLLMGCINFVNLAIGRASLRAAEVGVRKTVGAGNGQLMRQFIVEAAVLSVFGLGAGCALAELVLPAFNAIFSQELSLGLGEPSMLGALVALLLLVSLGAGWYPAFVLSRLEPLNAIRRNVSMVGITRFSRVLVGVQLAISVGLITCTLVMYHQLEHLMTRHEFEQDRIVAVHADILRDSNPKHPALVEAFLRHHRIASVAKVADDFLESSSRSDYRARTESGRETQVRHYTVDHNFVETMNIELIGGRDFSLAQGDKDNLALISESVAEQLGLADPIGETIKVGRMSSRKGFRPVLGARDGARIIGVVKDFTFESGYEDVPPSLLLLNPILGPTLHEVDLMFVRVKPGDMQEVIQHMREAWDSIVGYSDFHFSFLQQNLEAAYRDELRWRRLITWAAAGAVFISALGAFALTALAAGRRTKEIGIRKALGSSVFGITAMMAREFAYLALIGSAVAWPLSWWWMRDWLNGFAFRIDLAAWHFAAGAAIALVAVLLSSGHQAYKAAKADPVEALRYE